MERVRAIEPIEVSYAFFDTGLEHRATKRQIDYLERRYGVRIERIRPEKSIPTCVREFGQPVISKFVSEHISRLQRNGFRWEDEPFDALVERYPNCVSALRWWTNTNTAIPGEPGQFDIARKRWLKEFVIEHPPTFKVSNKCCEYTKKMVARDALRRFGCDLDMVGIRRSEGGVRAVGNQCFRKSKSRTGVDWYAPLYWWDDGTRRDYERAFGITHSDCYTVMGFKRTGCAGCPYNSRFDADNEAFRHHEPGLYRAVNTLFGDAYEWTRRFNEYRRERDSGQMTLDLRHARG